MAAGWLLGLASCAMTARTAPPPRLMYEWADDGGPGEVAVTLNLAKQMASYTRGGRPIGWSYICTGKPGHATPRGKFRITEKLELKLSGAYGWLEDATGNVTNGDATPATPVPPGESYIPAPMPHWMRLTAAGVGMHGGIIPQPGMTASHGCIRLPLAFAPQLYEVVKVGTPVNIIAGQPQSGPEELDAPGLFPILSFGD